MWAGPLEKISECKYRIPKSYKNGMLVDGIFYADEKLLIDIKKDKALEQVANVACLPGIVKYSLAMPDIHWGYGFCIGGVAATDPESGGVISPGGVGYDINCGVRLLSVDLTLNDIKDNLSKVADMLFNNVPAGVGSKGEVNLSYKDEKNVLIKGAKWAVSQGFGINEDLVYCEESGAIEGADPEVISARAYERGKLQVGTLGSGNHFLEVQVIDEIFDNDVAKMLNLNKNSITIMIHTGSRGFGYQVCDDSLRVMNRSINRYGINIPDRQLACAPVNTPEAKEYIGAMRAAANYAWANRQVLTHLVRKNFARVFGCSWESLGMKLIYDVAHNIAKFEEHVIDGHKKTLCVHRKGATRSFGPGNPDLPKAYQKIGQPVIIPGDMGRASYLLLGTRKAEQESFASTCHGAGRLKSRHEALRTLDYSDLIQMLKAKGIEVRARGKKTLVEEAPSVYKNVDDVVDVVEKAGLSRKVCKMRPLCVIKG